MRIIYAVALSCLVGLVTLGCAVDSGSYYDATDEVDVNVVVTIERQINFNPNSSVKIMALSVEEKDEGKTLVFQCPCFFGEDTRTDLSSVLKFADRIFLRLEVLPNAKYNITIEHLDTGNTVETETTR